MHINVLLFIFAFCDRHSEAYFKTGRRRRTQRLPLLAPVRSIKACASIGSVVARTCCTMPPTCNSHTHVRETRICSTLAIAVSISPSLFSMCILKLDSSCWTLKTDTSDCPLASPCKLRRCRSYAANVMLVRVLWRIRALPAKLCNLRLAVLRDGNAESRVLPFFVSTFHV
jgi:hypothetical protein